MSYIVSARKYRPKTFEDVVGQEQITTTLKRSIETDHLAQAFLFCGPRGVGKTTCARIMAKAVNTGKTEKLDEIDEDFSFNIFELDAASNNKVDDMHQLISQVRIPPQTGKYKIYIIDEVHMLSQAAFNAFLKTLEEPPPYAIFILATTEKHKILPTILSRCQIYDFKRIGVADIVKHLQDIAQQENIQADASALHIVAEKADGALRDALSIFDRLVSFAGNNLTYDAAVSSLNVLDYDYFFKITEQLLSADLASALLVLDDILNNGFEGDHFNNGLSNHFRNLLVCKDQRTIRLLEVSDELKQKYYNQANICSQEFLINSLSLAADCDINYAQSINKRLLVETTLMRMAYLANLKTNNSASLNTEHQKKNTSINQNTSSNQNTNTTLEAKKAPTLQEPQKDNAPVNTEVNKAETPIQNVQETVETPIEKKVKKTPKINLSLSLDDLEKAVEQELQKKPEQVSEKEADTEEVIMAGDLKLSQENLDIVWKNLLQKLKNEDLKRLYDIIDDKKPIFKEGTLIQLTADGEVEKTLINKDVHVITTFFKRNFKESNLQFEIIVDENESNRKIILNEKDKYIKMAEKNPSLEALKNNLDLELEL